MKHFTPLPFVIAEDVAVTELKSIVEYYLDEEVQEAEISTDYKPVLKAIRRGLLTFNEDMIPTLKLAEPIKNDAGEVSIEEIKFITRVPVSVQRSTSKGIDLKKDQLMFGQKMISYIISQPLAMLDKFGKHDYDVIQLLGGLFM